MRIKFLRNTILALTLLSGCSMRHIQPDYEIRHSNLGIKADIREVVVTDSKTRFYLTGIYSGFGLLSVMASVSSVGVIPVFGLVGLASDVSLTPFIYKDRAWIYHCNALRRGHLGVFYFDDSDDSKTKKYIGSLGCQRVGSNPPWLHAGK
jgi:hypothetical protein